MSRLYRQFNDGLAGNGSNVVAYLK